MPIEEVKPPEDVKPKVEADGPAVPVDPVQQAADERPKPRARPGSAKLRQQVAELYATIGMVAIAPVDRLAGTLVVKNADDLAEQWITLAETNSTVRAALEKLVEAGGWGGVIMAHGMIILPVLANRGMLPDQFANGIAFATVTAHPETADLFTHSRFSEPPQQPPTPQNGQGAV